MCFFFARVRRLLSLRTPVSDDSSCVVFVGGKNAQRNERRQTRRNDLPSKNEISTHVRAYVDVLRTLFRPCSWIENKEPRRWFEAQRERTGKETKTKKSKTIVSLSFFLFDNFESFSRNDMYNVNIVNISFKNSKTTFQKTKKMNK